MQLTLEVVDDNPEYIAIFRGDDKVLLRTADHLNEAGQLDCQIPLISGLNDIRVIVHDADEIIDLAYLHHWQEAEQAGAAPQALAEAKPDSNPAVPAEPEELIPLMTADFLPQRPRRNRRTAAMRDLMREHDATPRDLVLPVFVCEGTDQEQPIASMPGVARYSLDRLVPVAREAADLGVRGLALSCDQRPPQGFHGNRKHQS